MKLYEIVIYNGIDRKQYSKLILSIEPLNENSDLSSYIDNIEEYITELKSPIITINSWNETELDILTDIKNQLV